MKRIFGLILSLSLFCTFSNNCFANNPQMKELYEGVLADDIKAVKNAIKSGANVNIGDESDRAFSHNGYTPLGEAAFYNYYEVAKLLIKKGADINQTHAVAITAGTGSSDFLQYLFKKGGDVNLRNGKKQETPIFNATTKCNVANARVLIDEGADLNVSNYFSETPLHRLSTCLSVYRDVDEAVAIGKLFIDNGANPNVRSADKRDNRGRVTPGVTPKEHLVKTMKRKLKWKDITQEEFDKINRELIPLL